MLGAAALAARFSAAVEGTSGSGGLINDLTHGRLSARQAYAVLVLGGLALTWTADLFENQLRVTGLCALLRLAGRNRRYWQPAPTAPCGLWAAVRVRYRDNPARHADRIALALCQTPADSARSQVNIGLIYLAI